MFDHFVDIMHYWAISNHKNNTNWNHNFNAHNAPKIVYETLCKIRVAATRMCFVKKAAQEIIVKLTSKLLHGNPFLNDDAAVCL